MSHAVAAEKVAASWQAPESRPLDETVWHSWLAKGRDQQQRSRLTASKAVRCGSTLALLAGAALGAQLGPYDVMVRFAIGAGAVAMMVQTLRERQFAFAALFAIIAVLFNPIAPVVNFSAGWERAFAAASAIPFVAPLAWGNRKQARHA